MTAKYILDTCSWIELRESYKKKVFPGVWNSIERFIVESHIKSPFEVFVELEEKENDEVFQWVKTYRDTSFISAPKETQMGVRALLKKYPKLIDISKAKDGADPFVIQVARELKAAVVTEEQKSGQIQFPMIPDVCQAEGIECINLIDVLDREGCVFG